MEYFSSPKDPFHSTFGISPNRLNRTIRWIAKTNQIADDTTPRSSNHVDGEEATEYVEQLKLEKKII